VLKSINVNAAVWKEQANSYSSGRRRLLVSIFMKTEKPWWYPPYADLDEKVLMQASLQHTFSFKPAHG
ncbi:MAG: hypothetical protein V8R61_07835, partial [Enterocloster sp.]